MVRLGTEGPVGLWVPWPNCLEGYSAEGGRSRVQLTGVEEPENLL